MDGYKIHTRKTEPAYFLYHNAQPINLSKNKCSQVLRVS